MPWARPGLVQCQGSEVMRHARLVFWEEVLGAVDGSAGRTEKAQGRALVVGHGSDGAKQLIEKNDSRRLVSGLSLSLITRSSLRSPANLPSEEGLPALFLTFPCSLEK